MILQAKDLSPDQKAVIESLLGRRVLANESISVRAIESPALSEQDRRNLADKLRKYFAQIDSQRAPEPADDAEEILTEAIRSVRPSYHPHQ